MIAPPAIVRVIDGDTLVIDGEHVRIAGINAAEYDMAQSNAWAVNAGQYLETMLAADRHEQARKELKALVPDDASKCFGHGITINREKCGALRFATTQGE